MTVFLWIVGIVFFCIFCLPILVNIACVVALPFVAVNEAVKKAEAKERREEESRRQEALEQERRRKEETERPERLRKEAEKAAHEKQEKLRKEAEDKARKEAEEKAELERRSKLTPEELVKDDKKIEYKRRLALLQGIVKDREWGKNYSKGHFRAFGPDDLVGRHYDDDCGRYEEAVRNLQAFKDEHGHVMMD